MILKNLNPKFFFSETATSIAVSENKKIK